jgi:hypothetical protein
MAPSAFNRRTNTMAQKKKAYAPKKKGAPRFGGKQAQRSGRSRR